MISVGFSNDFDYNTMGAAVAIASAFVTTPS